MQGKPPDNAHDSNGFTDIDLEVEIFQDFDILSCGVFKMNVFKPNSSTPVWGKFNTLVKRY